MVPTPKTKAKIVSEVQDFIVLPLHFPSHTSQSNPNPKVSESTTPHYLYLRPNVPRIPTDDTPRELFLVNVPVDATERSLRLLFAEHVGGGRVEGMEFEDTARVANGRGRGIKAPAIVSEGKKGKKRKRGSDREGVAAAEVEGEEVGGLPETWDRALHRSGATAVVRFVDPTSAQLALRAARKAVKTGRRTPWTPVPENPPLGEARYRAHHALRHPDPVVLQNSVDVYMAAFAAREAESARLLARQRMEPDADGFITVVRGGRNGPARSRPEGNEGADDRDEQVEGGVAAVGTAKRKKKGRGNAEEGFYRFQVRERKKREHGELARRFEEDARRVEEMRRRRGRVKPE